MRSSRFCCAVRTAAFGVRAAYTVHYRPALSGTWLAFNNAGFGANIATLCLALGTWYASHPVPTQHFLTLPKPNFQLLTGLHALLHNASQCLAWPFNAVSHTVVSHAG